MMGENEIELPFVCFREKKMLNRENALVIESFLDYVVWAFDGA